MSPADETWSGTFSYAGRTVSLSSPESLWLLLAVPLLLVAFSISVADLPWQQRLLSFLFRGLFFAALVVGLSVPQESTPSTRVCTVALVDVSTSVSDADLEKFLQELSLLHSAKKEKDDLRLVAFGERASEISLSVSETGQLLLPEISDLRGADAGRETDVSEALLYAAAFTSTDCVRRYVLYSDGIATRGEALSSVLDARARGVRLYTHLLSEAPPKDVAVTALDLPGGVRTGEPFRVRVSVRATAPVKAELRLYQGDALNGLSGVQKVDLPQGLSTHSFDSVVHVPGDVTYKVELTIDGADQFKENNSFTASLEVPGPPRVLLVDREVGQATYLAQALSAQKLDVDVRAPSAFPASVAELSAFQFVVLSDVARKDMSRGAEALLLTYVRAGGGLLYAGGEAGFGPGGWQGSALEKALPVRMDGQKDREIPAVAMALVIDRSGSMGGLPLSMAKEACNATIKVLSPNDLIEVIAFDSRPTRFVSMQPARYRARMEAQISTIVPGGGTEIFPALDMAYQDLLSVSARKKHIILLTDGNSGSDGIYELSGAAFADGITVTAVGLGGGVNRALLEMLSETGGGRFHAAEDPSHLPQIFTRETELISKKADVGDWFPVTQVRSPQFLSGVAVASAPLLRGYTSTQMKPPPAELILQSDRAEPILARQPYGLGWTLAWTSDLKTRWALDWLKWGQFGRFIAQLVREHQRSDDEQVRPMTVDLEGETWVATVEAFDKDGNFDNHLRSTLSVRLTSRAEAQAGPEKKGGSEKQSEQSGSLEVQVPFYPVAPGTYQARAPASFFGAYALKATHERLTPDKSLRPAGVSFASASRPYPTEYRDLTPKPEVMERWARTGGGQASESPERIFSAGSDQVKGKRPRQNDFLLAAIMLLLLDLLMRRVRLFDRRPGAAKVRAA